MLTLFLLAPVLSPIGLGIALWAYPWRRPAWTPYLPIVAVLIAPLLALCVLQMLFTLPPGTCAEDKLGWLVMTIVWGCAGLAILTAVLARSARRFAIGVGLLFCPLTFFWSMVTMMALQGCWI